MELLKSRKVRKLSGAYHGVVNGPKWLAALSLVWSGVATANMVGSDTQNFNPTTSGRDLVTVQSSSTLGGFGNYSLGLWFNWATNTLPYFDQADGTNRDKAKKVTDSVTSMDMVAGMGLTENWDLGIAVPFVVDQTIKSSDRHGQFGKTGNTEIRATTKYRLWNNDTSGIAAVGSVNFNQIKNNPYAGKSSRPVFNAELIGDTKISDLLLALNIGYRFRNPGGAVSEIDGSTPIEPLRDQFIGSVGAGYLIPGTDLEVIGEVYGGKPNNNALDTSPRSESTIEGIAGLRYYVGPETALHAGLGTELAHSLSSPDLRVYVGITWSPSREKKVEVAPVAEAPASVVQAAVAPAPSEFPKPDEIIVLRDVLFNFNSAELNHKTAKKNLTTLTRAITGPNGLSKLVIEGHTCSVGSDAYNLSLSRRRAAALKKWLAQELGLASASMISVGYGESRPIATNKTDNGRELNRRVEFKIYHANNPGFAGK